MASKFRTFEISNPAFSPENLRFVTVKSRNLQGRGDCTLFMPPALKKITSEVPVIILLHGVYASHWAWTYNINVHEIAIELIRQKKIRPCVLVMPSDGLAWDGTGYLDHGGKNYEKWITEDVVAIVRQAIPNDGNALSLCIAGLSMGGYGALRLMARHTDLFVAASGLSSITRMSELMPFLASEEKKYFHSRFRTEKLIDELERNKKRLPLFRFDCGSKDKLIHANRRLHQQLGKAMIPHIFEENTGGHSNEYWQANIAKTLLFFDSIV